MTPAATFGGSGNRRITKTFYSGNGTDDTADRVKKIEHSNGKLKTYSYEYGNYDSSGKTFTADAAGTALRTTLVNGTVDYPDGIACKTTKIIKIKDSKGDEVLTETYTYTGSDYVRIRWTAKVFDGRHRLMSETKSNNTIKEETWNCCYLQSTTSTEGIQYTYTYDPLNRLKTKTRKSYGTQPDIVTTYDYDANDNILSESVSSGSQTLTTHKTYDRAGRITRATNPSGLVTSYVYTPATSSSGEIVTKTLPGGATEITEMYLDGRVKSVTGTAVVAKYYTYGANVDGSQWEKVSYGSENSLRWTRTTVDCLGRKIKEENSGYNNGIVTAQYFYNAKGQLIRETRTGRGDMLYVYDNAGNLVRSGLDVNGNGTLDLASNDRILEHESGDVQENGDWWRVKNQKVYGTENSDTATAVVTSKIRLTGFSGNVISEARAVDRFGNSASSVTTLDRVNKTVTNTVTYPDSTVPEQSVIVNGLLTSLRTSANLTYTYSYDSLARRTGETDPRTGTTVTAYYTSGTGKIGQVQSITDPAGHSTVYDYDPATGRLSSQKNALGKYAYYAYNDLGQITRSWGDTDYPIEKVYDQYGQLINLKTYRGGTGWNGASWPADPGTADVTAWTYDPASGLNTAKTYADGKSTSYTYSTDGKLLTRTWARLNNGQPLSTAYSYDAKTGELLVADYSDATTDLVYTYNRLGQQKTVTDAVGSRTFAYNAAFQPVTETITGLYDKTITRSYSATGVVGRYTGVGLGAEYGVTYDYDDYGRLNQVANGSDVFGYSRLAHSNLIAAVTRPGSLSTAFTYETNRNLVTGVENKYDTTTVSAYGYANDTIGRRTSMSRLGAAFAQADVISYTYDDRSEVTGAVSNTISTYDYGFNFDNIGNRLTSRLVSDTTSYTANNVNQYTAVTTGGNTFNPIHDDDGNTLSLSSNGSQWSLTWNAENRLVKAESTTQKLEFAYDYAGRRVEKKVSSGSEAIGWTLTKTERFVYDGFKLIEKLDGTNSNAIVQKFTWQPGVLGQDVPLAVFDIAANSSYFYQVDVNKNIGQLIDVSGNIVAKYEYSPFGRIVSASGSYAEANPFRFSSEYFDVETGLVYYNYRYYNVESGRWLSRDPIEEAGGENLYRFNNNNAIKYYDHLGAGPLDWVMTGKWNPSYEEAEAADRGWMDGFGFNSGMLNSMYTGKNNPSEEEQNAAMEGAQKAASCYANCMKNVNKRGYGVASGILGGLTAAAGRLGPLKPPGTPPYAIGEGHSGSTSYLRQFSQYLGEKGFGRNQFPRNVVRDWANEVKRHPIRAVLKGVVAGVAIAETAAAIYCSQKCYCKCP